MSIFFIFGIDLLSIQVAYANLDSKAISISYLISKRGTLNDGLVDYIETTYNVEFICLSNCSLAISSRSNCIIGSSPSSGSTFEI